MKTHWLRSQIFNSRFRSSQIRWDSILAPFDMLYNAAAHISHSVYAPTHSCSQELFAVFVVTMFSVSLDSTPTCFEKTAMSSLKDSELQTSPPATPGSRGVHVASSHFSKMSARRGKRGCLKQGDFSRKKRRREGGEREYFGRDRQISIGYANWAGERGYLL